VGKGGRNQEFVLAVLAKLGSREMIGVTVLSGGTDGEDGPTDAAGAAVDSQTLEDVTRANLDVELALASHNSYPLLDRVGALIRSGLTGTNVMDVRTILVR
jgi:hydroxypyruvate reductase/glycerate 2-kinase